MRTKERAKKYLKNHQLGHTATLPLCLLQVHSSRQSTVELGLCNDVTAIYNRHTSFQKYSRLIAECAVEAGGFCAITRLSLSREDTTDHSLPHQWKNTSQEWLHLFQPWFAVQLDELLYHSPRERKWNWVLSLGLDLTLIASQHPLSVLSPKLVFFFCCKKSIRIK